MLVAALITIRGRGPVLVMTQTFVAWFVAVVLACFAVLLVVKRMRQAPKPVTDQAPTQWRPSPQTDAKPGELSDQPDRLSTHWLERSTRVAPALPPNGWSVALIREIEWARFEELCQGFWMKRGYPAELTGLGADGGVDVLIREQADASKNFAVIQCKSWDDRVGVEPVRALWGSKDHFGAKLAIFYSTAGFSKDALNFASGKNLKLMTAEDLLKQIETLPREQQNELLVQVTRGDYTTPSCPACGEKKVRRKSKGGKREFWGCRNYPRCNSSPIWIST